MQQSNILYAVNCKDNDNNHIFYVVLQERSDNNYTLDVARSGHTVQPLQDAKKQQSNFYKKDAMIGGGMMRGGG
jgi:hypothetical protein